MDKWSTIILWFLILACTWFAFQFALDYHQAVNMYLDARHSKIAQIMEGK